MRVGRHVGGNAAMIKDLLFHEDASILFLGEPGSGKTTIVREATRLLAEVGMSFLMGERARVRERETERKYRLYYHIY
jgi:stage III sporulation protein SpoIIIAA